MSYFMNNQQKLNDIIFAERNKEYGAYAIRSSYGTTVLRSLACTLLGVGALALTAYFLTRDPGGDIQKLDGQINDTFYVIPFNNPPEDKVDPADKKKDPPKPAENKNAESSRIIVDSANVENDPNITNTLVAASSSLSVASGEKPESSGSTSVTGTTNTITSGAGIKGAYEVDSGPEFEGGLKALYAFISSHLRYPDWASREGKEGKVFVKFVVDENGKVEDLSLLNSAGYGMDDEALRVVSLIPRFKSPAKVNGQAVKVYYQLPIRFKFN